MAFMEKQVEFGTWLEVDTCNGTEFIPADITGPTGWMKDGAPYDCDGTFEEDSNLKLLLENLEDYLSCNSEDVISVTIKQGWGARLSAPGYMDCTEWAVFATFDEANEYLDEMYGDEE